MDLALLKESGHINGMAMVTAAGALVSGISTREVSEAAQRVVEREGAQSALREVGFPGFCCVSVNNQVGHGVPGSQRLCKGDVVKIDIAIRHRGMYTDAARTYVVGSKCQSSAEHLGGLGEHLMWLVRSAARAGVQALRPDCALSDVSQAMGDVVRQSGFAVVRHALGHGTGTALHTWPIVPSFGPGGRGPRARWGWVLAIEPVIAAGKGRVHKLPDGWTEATVDGSLAAHWEDTVWVGEDGAVIVTELPATGLGESTNGVDCPGSGMRILTGGWMTRWMGAADAREVVQLAESQMNPMLIEAWGRRVDPKEIIEVKDACTLVARDAVGHLAGFITFSVSANRAIMHIQTLVLSPQCQGSGLAQQLLQEVERRARARRLLRLELWVQTNNPRAQRFYAREGFVESDSPYLHSLRMCKILSQGADGNVKRHAT